MTRRVNPGHRLAAVACALVMSLALAVSTSACPSSGGGGGGTVKDPPKPDGDKPASVSVWCDFGTGYAALLPKDLYDPKEEYLMQILIGLHEDADNWKEPEYAKYANWEATDCEGDINGQFLKVEPGEYMLLVGWVGRYDANNGYENNGFVKPLTVAPGSRTDLRLKEEDMQHSWSCISCPFLQVFDGKGWVELGQVLRNRQSPALGGTDTVDMTVHADGGVVTLRLDEREPETTYLDAIALEIGGQPVPLVTKVPGADAIDGRFVTLRKGEQLELKFSRPGLADGPHRAVLRISGHYVPFVRL